MSEPTLVSVGVAADRLGVKRRTVIYHINQGHLRASKLSGAVTSAFLVDAADLERFAAERETTPDVAQLG